MSTSMQLYIIGGLEILIPVLALILLRKSHKYRISSVISGIGGYFLAVNLLMGLVSMMLASVGLDQAFWAEHNILSEITNILLNVLFQGTTIYLIMRYVLKGNVRIYDAMALGISYWLADAMMLSTSAVSYARVASMSAEGRLTDMVTESLSLEMLNEYAAALQEMGISSFYMQLLGVCGLCIMTAVLSVFIYHSIKRKNIKFLLLAMVGHLIMLSLLNLSLVLGGNWFYVGANVVVILVSVLVFMQYWKWYKAQQADLLRRRQEYQQYIKAAGGNVVSVRPTETPDLNAGPAESSEKTEEN